MKGRWKSRDQEPRDGRDQEGLAPHALSLLEGRVEKLAPLLTYNGPPTRQRGLWALIATFLAGGQGREEGVGRRGEVGGEGWEYLSLQQLDWGP